jgi:hypothetical protein
MDGIRGHVLSVRGAGAGLCGDWGGDGEAEERGKIGLSGVRLKPQILFRDCGTGESLRLDTEAGVGGESAEGRKFKRGNT